MMPVLLYDETRVRKPCSNDALGYHRAPNSRSSCVPIYRFHCTNLSPACLSYPRLSHFPLACPQSDEMDLRTVGYRKYAASTLASTRWPKTMRHDGRISLYNRGRPFHSQQWYATLPRTNNSRFCKLAARTSRLEEWAFLPSDDYSKSSKLGVSVTDKFEAYFGLPMADLSMQGDV